MTHRSLLFDSLWHYRRSHIAVALGVAVATAVLTGALLIGDSVRGSLRDLTLQRLGAIDYALATPQPFRAKLADELADTPGFDQRFGAAAPALVLSAAASRQTDDGTRRANDVTLLGVTPAFGEMDTFGAAAEPWEIVEGEVWLTRALADELDAREGDDVFFTLPSVEAIPADSPLGEKSEVTVGRRLKVARVLADEGLARFSLTPSQRPPRNAFASIGTVQDAVDRAGDANLLLVAGGNATADDVGWLKDALRPTLADYGLTVETVADGRAVQIASEQLVLRPAIVQAAEREFNNEDNEDDEDEQDKPPVVQKVVTYLANTIRVGDQPTPQIPYSTITGVDSTEQLGPLLDDDGQPIVLADDEVALNSWAAEPLDATVGDTIRITYYAPESTHGELVEPEPLRLRLAAIVDLESPDGEPTPAADPRLTPELAGVTDAETISQWDTPFELVEEIRPADEEYWDEYSTTPKAFVSLDLAKRLWGTRWGSISLLRIPASETAGVEAVAARLREAIEPTDVGFALQPIKQRGLEAASGTTPFDGLFFGFSMFLIASSVMLISLLYRLGVDQRAREVGLLTATGWTAAQIRRALIIEGVVVAAVGAALGVGGGVAYAWLMLWGLRTVWVEAIVTPFLTLHVTWLSLVIGLVVGLLAAWLTIRLSLRGLAQRSPRALLAGQTESPRARPRAARRGRWLTVALLGLAVALGAYGAAQQGEAQAGAFFGSGALVLAALVLRIRAWLITREVRVAAPDPFGLGALAARNVSRNPGRTLLTIALVGAASFLILAISAFRLPPTEQGTGGYALVGASDQPLHYDLNTPEGRLEFGLNRDDEALLDQFRVDALRVHDGEDASCLNLYQTQQPRVLGVPTGFGADADFAWADDGGAENPWALLESGASKQDGPIPVILDFNTAMYSLKLYDGVGATLTIRDAADQQVTLEVVALLKNSVLQGDLLMSQENFLDLFPETGGFRFFLVEAVADDADPAALAAMLEDRLGDYGLDLQSARQRLVEFLAVQNTYLSTFQSLGALGLLLGAVGVAVVQLRNVAQRRGELALLRAAGYAPARLSDLVLRENLLLLVGGLAVGAVAAVVALVPQSLQHDTRAPWLTTALLLGVIAAVGLVVGWLATRRTLRAPILPALRGD